MKLITKISLFGGVIAAGAYIVWPPSFPGKNEGGNLGNEQETPKSGSYERVHSNEEPRIEVEGISSQIASMSFTRFPPVFSDRELGRQIGIGFLKSGIEQVEWKKVTLGKPIEIAPGNWELVPENESSVLVPKQIGLSAGNLEEITVFQKISSSISVVGSNGEAVAHGMVFWSPSNETLVDGREFPILDGISQMEILSCPCEISVVADGYQTFKRSFSAGLPAGSNWSVVLEPALMRKFIVRSLDTKKPVMDGLVLFPAGNRVQIKNGSLVIPKNVQESSGTVEASGFLSVINFALPVGSAGIIELCPSKEIEVVVQDSLGSPIEGAQVLGSISPEVFANYPNAIYPSPFIGYSDKDGLLKVPVARIAPTSLRAFHSESRTATIEPVIVNPGENQVVLTLHQSNKLTLNLVSADGEAMDFFVQGSLGGKLIRFPSVGMADHVDVPTQLKWERLLIDYCDGQIALAPLNVEDSTADEFSGVLSISVPKATTSIARVLDPRGNPIPYCKLLLEFDRTQAIRAGFERFPDMGGLEATEHPKWAQQIIKHKGIPVTTDSLGKLRFAGRPGVYNVSFVGVSGEGISRVLGGSHGSNKVLCPSVDEQIILSLPVACTVFAFDRVSNQPLAEVTMASTVFYDLGTNWSFEKQSGGIWQGWIEQSALNTVEVRSEGWFAGNPIWEIDPVSGQHYSSIFLQQASDTSIQIRYEGNPPPPNVVLVSMGQGLLGGASPIAWQRWISPPYSAPVIIPLPRVSLEALARVYWDGPDARKFFISPEMLTLKDGEHYEIAIKEVE